MWQSEIVLILRHMIGDLTEPYAFCDSRLEELFLVAARYVASDISFPTDYTVNIGQMTLSPDPTVERDDAFISLTCLYAVCLLARSELRLASGQAVGIADGNTRVDLGGIFGSKDKYADRACKAYEDAKAEFQFSDAVGGTIIVGPYSFISGRYAGRSGGSAGYSAYGRTLF